MPTIETERLRLRMFRPDDLDDLAAMFADPEVVKYVGEGKPASREEAAKALDSIIANWSKNGFGRWAAIDKATDAFIGFGGLRSLFGTPEVVYHLAKENWGKGFATELGRAALRFGFEDRGFDRIVAITKPLNAASIHVLEKLGMKYEKHAHYYDLDVVQYEIGRNEFKWDGSAYTLRAE
ncbi:MAG TPA: GNAT family N-acetyltransferase [Pyrinomonadaceae bacterium]|jgi:ribosomal-protein-alanine N-acetyltransferase